MRAGLLLDNLDSPAESSYAKLQTMGAGCVGTLWTQTHHRRAVYERCENLLGKPLYLLRVSGWKQTAWEWLSDAKAALAEVPDAILNEKRLVLTFGNEPNIEWDGTPEEYGQHYWHAVQGIGPTVLFACPSVGLSDWPEWFRRAYEAAGRPRQGIVNLYAGNVNWAGTFAGYFTESLYVGEVNSAASTHSAERVKLIRGAFEQFAAASIKAATVFIAGGKSNGAWDEGYILSEEEAAGLAGWGGSVAFTWKLKFATYAAMHPEVGTPVTDIAYDMYGNALQYSDKGLLLAHKGDDWRVYWLARPLA